MPCLLVVVCGGCGSARFVTLCHVPVVVAVPTPKVDEWVFCKVLRNIDDYIPADRCVFVCKA